MVHQPIVVHVFHELIIVESITVHILHWLELSVIRILLEVEEICRIFHVVVRNNLFRWNWFGRFCWSVSFVDFWDDTEAIETQGIC